MQLIPWRMVHDCTRGLLIKGPQKSSEMKDSAWIEKHDGPNWPAKGFNSVSSMKRHHGSQEVSGSSICPFLNGHFCCSVDRSKTRHRDANQKDIVSQTNCRRSRWGREMTGNFEKFLEMKSMGFSNKLNRVGEAEGGFQDEAQISGLGAGFKKYSILD